MTFDELQAELRRHLRCAICGTPVERIRRFTQLDRGVVAFEVMCHGDTEVVDVTYSSLEGATKIDIVPAFGRGLLAAAQ